MMMGWHPGIPLAPEAVQRHDFDLGTSEEWGQEEGQEEGKRGRGRGRVDGEGQKGRGRGEWQAEGKG